MSNFGDLVRRLRKERGMTLEAVARKIGSHKGYVSGIENGKVSPPSVKFIRKFARLFDWDEKEMVRMAYVDKAPKLIHDEVERLLNSWESDAAPSGGIPVVNTLATGYSSEVNGSGIPKALSAGTIALPKSKSKVEFAVTVADSSMERGEGPSFSRGDVVLLSGQATARNGDMVYVIYSARQKRQAVLRQVMLEQNEHVVLQPLNKDYPLEFLTHDDIDALYRVVGKIELYENAAVEARV